jgi:trehalose/maltose hydrolase-like predicted phosphorylase
VRVRSTRLVSFTHRAIAAIRYEVEPLDRRTRITVQSELVANETLPEVGGDPRASAALRSPLQPEEHAAQDAWGLLIHRTRASKLRMAAAMNNEVTGPEAQVHSESMPDWARTTITTVLDPGEPLVIVKTVGYGWSSLRSLPALRGQAAAALAGARFAGWDGLVAEQREFLDKFWDDADVVVDGDPAVQQAVRFGLFHVMQAGARVEQRPIAAKGLTGPGYDGHVFWDTESFVLPVLTYTAPQAAAAGGGQGAALAAQRHRPSPRTGAAARPGRRRLPVAHHPRPGVLRLLAGQHSGLPHQRRHRGRHCTQAVLAAEVGHLELAYGYIGEAALMDLRDVEHNTRDGVHLASLAGAWIALVGGLGGMRDHDGQLSFAPRLPSRLDRLEFSLLWRGHRLRVTIGRSQATYSIRDGHGTVAGLLHYGEPVTVSAGHPVRRPIPPCRP